MASHLLFHTVLSFKMKSVSLAVFSVFFLFVTGCIQEFDLKTKDAVSRVVVEATITNKPGPYIVRLTKSHSGKYVDPDYSNIDNAEAIVNATVILIDNTGVTDTLKPMYFNPDEYEWSFALGLYKFLRDDFGNVIDTVYWKFPTEFTHDRGFYMTSSIEGIPGRTYYLKVIAEGIEYTASSSMPQVPVIDSVGLIRKVSDKDGQVYYIPTIYFREPQGITNFYLVQLSPDELVRTFSDAVWPFFIFSDEYLEPYVNGLNLGAGQTLRNDDFTWFFGGDSVYVGLSSLTREGYDYYSSLIRQFKNDGGVYQPAPSSPPTNLSNGALGFFRTSAISESGIRIPYALK
jgi:hypothetical protein